jgi:hypothetical protein
MSEMIEGRSERHWSHHRTNPSHVLGEGITIWNFVIGEDAKAIASPPESGIRFRQPAEDSISRFPDLHAGSARHRLAGATWGVT